MESLLTAENLSFRHRIPAPRFRNPLATRAGPGLYSISFTIPRGRLVGLVGPNGAGKTTLLQILAGLRHPDSGSLELDGHPNLRAGTGFMPDMVRWNGQSTPQGVLRRLSKMSGASPDGLLELVGLASRADDPLDVLSTGMRQRLSLATALLGKPELLLLDEPFTGLDPVAQKALSILLRELTDSGTSVIISSHLLNELESNVDDIILLHDGQILIEGEITSIRRKLGLDRRLTIAGMEGDPDPHLEDDVVESYDEDGWIRVLEREGGWSRRERAALVERLSQAGATPHQVQAEIADLSSILEAATASNGMDVSMHAMIPRRRVGGEEE